MKKNLFIVTLIVTFLTLGFTSCKNKTLKNIQLTNKSDTLNYFYGVSYGQFLQQNLSMQLGDEYNNDLFADAMYSFLKGEVSLLSEDEMEAFMQSYIEEIMEQQNNQYQDSEVEEFDQEEQKAFMDNFAKETGVVVTESGLMYKVLTEGKGQIPTEKDNVEVHYTGTFINGDVFDSSVERGEPAVFGVTQVIPGWTEALLKMPVGSKWKVVLPPELGYGDRDLGTIPPNSVLVFTIELLSIK